MPNRKCIHVCVFKSHLRVKSLFHFFHHHIPKTPCGEPMPLILSAVVILCSFLSAFYYDLSFLIITAACHLSLFGFILSCWSVSLFWRDHVVLRTVLKHQMFITSSAVAAIRHFCTHCSPSSKSQTEALTLPWKIHSNKRLFDVAIHFPSVLQQIILWIYFYILVLL